ncbi:MULTISPECIES: cytochrome bc complex cytochrome b subunit [unclassified Luteimonas]|uniref:cytochrome b n=1 Tax=unclassified Luteimonas TaxID=2629088 RepID=UPI0018F06F44|nr:MULTISPECIES: cytochrome bc complex cytochrome b subunit [unclassified Luteimonas]MBJ6982607.1 cytochrome bc complex cytochrome b subunit [Luteimonas sp. MC1572]MBJ7574816.1 cytochrome bc complex cytochrome b subunit [Luteimonas sp. MC1828]QQO03854.1 cytochrome bc complex cytochrome b subunit [Luteimonas sp. MC1572]
MSNVITRTANNVMDWVNERAPGMMPMYRKHMTEYYAPKNFNFWYYMGSLAMLVLVNQIVTGIFLTMHYKPSAAEAFSSVEYIMRDVEWGWLIRYMHSTGASLFFIVVYLHMFRGLMYGSYQKPRELVWILGMLIYLVLMAEAFLGYVLPWGQMSFWGAKVIISLFGAVPVIGTGLTEWIMGDYLPSDATLNRFFALHVIALPLVLLLLVVLHLGALHEVGSNNPDGVDIKKGPKGNRWDPNKPADGIPFHPYYTVKDLVGVGFFLMIAAFIIFFAPAFGGWFLEHDNFTEANRLVTPAHIKPVWYYTPYYAMLRVVPHKLSGVLVMFGAIAILFLVPWLDRCKVKSYRYRGLMSKVLLGLFAISFVWLGKIGAGPGTDPVETIIGRVLTFFYFAFFITMPLWTKIDSTRPVPERVTTHD